MSSRARVTAIAVGVILTISLLAWWAMRERRPEPAGAGSTADALALEVLGTDASVPLPGQDPNPKPVIDGVVQPRYDGVSEPTSATADGGIYAGEQPPDDYEGEVTDVIGYEPEVVEPVVGPEVVQLTEAQLTTRRRGQVELIDQTIETLEGRIDRARDEGNETMVHLLEARRERLRERRETLAGM